VTVTGAYRLCKCPSGEPCVTQRQICLTRQYLYARHARRALRACRAHCTGAPHRTCLARLSLTRALRAYHLRCSALAHSLTLRASAAALLRARSAARAHARARASAARRSLKRKRALGITRAYPPTSSIAGIAHAMPSAHCLRSETHLPPARCCLAAKQRLALAQRTPLAACRLQAYALETAASAKRRENCLKRRGAGIRTSRRQHVDSMATKPSRAKRQRAAAAQMCAETWKPEMAIMETLGATGAIAGVSKRDWR